MTTLNEIWPNCATPDCENKRCLWSGTPLCYPCAVLALGQVEMDAAYKATHPDDETTTKGE